MTKILISIRPKWVVKILNKKKTVEIRKSMPKCEFPCEVYIYCTKGKNISVNNCTFDACINHPYICDKTTDKYYYDFGVLNEPDCLNGKVVAKFILKMVDEADVVQARSFSQDSEIKNEISTCMCRSTELTWKELYEYCKDREKVYCWYIDDLEIFEHPKTLQDYGLTKVPQSWCYIKKENKYD